MSKGLTTEELQRRRERQRATAAQPNCSHCRNKAPLGAALCNRCQQILDSANLKERTAESITTELVLILSTSGFNQIHAELIVGVIVELINATIDVRNAD